MTDTTYTPLRRIINKVPEVTFLFWIIKMMSTTVGETAADYLNVDMHFDLTGTSLVTGILLALTLVFQVRARKYAPPLYWLSVVLVSVFGTLITDNLTDKMGIPLATSTLAFSLALLVVFAIWYAREHTLSIHNIDSVSRELFYWLAVLTTFALGTAAGDWFSEGLDLGYATSAAVFGAAIAAVATAYYAFNANGILCFWIAFILTRPLGASLGDLLSQPAKLGGLDIGATTTSVLFLAIIVSLVAYLSAANARVGKAAQTVVINEQ